MKYFAALPLVASLAAAQYSSVAASAAAGAMTHTVTVGGVVANPTGTPTPNLLYQPESIVANVGDMVEFVFLQANHTVTQSSFANPCVKMEGGVDSGFMPNPSGSPGVNFMMPVTVSTPTWFYCKQKGHCGKGMVFAVNAMTTGDKTFSAYKQLAIVQNGTALSTAAIVATPATQVASTVTIEAGSVTAAAASATVAVGQGQLGDGSACSCECLCGVNSFPPSAAQGNFGGFAGMLSK
ncbi:hypothetical protein K432DRAFT_173661 [Lepidopterella palustris CBS 459.81]|uniref:Cupredoxin n=1 Tax=Lepidopterella palustris CBS 459.81 TaxID=1314670 RepID=A0A8E2EGJ8_9PEZI|nr:hypothetical protein K432DRAFT_173661 [Lepidopterella palustris CBS 459.81]